MGGGPPVPEDGAGGENHGSPITGIAELPKQKGISEPVVIVSPRDFFRDFNVGRRDIYVF